MIDDTTIETEADDQTAGATPAPEPRDRWLAITTFALLAVTAVTLYIEANTEPFHIDELRQVRPYALSFDEIVDAAFDQEQPPLDSLAGSVTQRILGVGDVIQRVNAMGAAMVVAATIALLLWRRGVRIGAPVTVGLLAVAPLYLSIAAYARPYALPLMLMMGWIVGAEYWLERGRIPAAVLVTVCALLLPLSRVFEPPAFLVLAPVTLLWYRRRHPEWGARVWLPIGGAAMALLAVELPVYLRLRERLGSYRSETSASWSEQWERLVDDSLPRLGSAFEIGWLALAVVVLVVANAEARSLLARLWWFWPLAATAISFAVAFHLRTEPTQPFYDRYGFYWWPPFAIGVGALAQAVGDTWNLRSARHWISVSAIGAMCAVLVVALINDVRTDAHPDLRTLGGEIEARLPPTTAVVYDTTSRRLGSYRPGYAGYGRYTTPQRPILKAETLIWAPAEVPADLEYAIATNGRPLAVDGWLTIEVTTDLALYLPDRTRSGPVDMAEDLVAVGEQLAPSRGAVFRLGGASLYFDQGEAASGCREVQRLIDEAESLLGAIERSLRGTSMSGALDVCPGGNPLRAPSGG